MATYGDVDGVLALVPTVGGFGADTTPSEYTVIGWLTEGDAILNRAIAGAGYSVPVGTIATVYSELSALNNLYAGAYVLRARSIDTVSGESEDRSEVWLADFWRRLDRLVASDLSLVGASPLPATNPTRRRRIRTLQMRKVDGYSRGNAGEAWAVQQGEYTGASAPSE